jgi:3-phosphoshikimate 1-carboxyvinyltransferase
MEQSFRPIQPVREVRAAFTAPPSKSVTQRALILAALADGPSRLLAPLDATDSRTLLRALEILGLGVRRGAGAWEIDGGGGRIPAPGAELDAGDAGTAARFLTALVTLGSGRFVVDGSARMRQRPIAPLVEALRRLGVEIRCRGAGGCPPVEVDARGLPGGTIRVPGALSSQYLSAVLLASPGAQGRLRLEPEGPIASIPYLRLTGEVMEAFGIPVREPAPLTFELDAPFRFPGRTYRVEGDYSSAGYFFAAAAVTGGTVRVDNLRPASAQADRGILAVLEEMGCRVETREDGWSVTGGALRGFDRNLESMPDAAPTLAVAALFAAGPSRLSGLRTLRIKESDRVAVLAAELRKLGAGVSEGSDSLEIVPRPPRAADIETHQDHRMAMAFAVAGLRIPGVRIAHPGCVAKSFPDYWEEFRRLENPAGE